MILFVDTYSMLRAQRGELPLEELAPIIVYDEETDTFERTAQAEVISGRVMFDMSPDHNLARVWVEADKSDLKYDGQPCEWNAKQRRTHENHQ